MKKCNSCGKTKESFLFHKRSASKDGLSAKCKECQKEYDASRLCNKERALKRAEYQKGGGREFAASAKASWIKKNPGKRKAHNAVSNAIRDGRLTKKPCEICGSSQKVHAHHDDYSKWFDVRWLCPAHHSEWHRLNGEALNP